MQRLVFYFFLWITIENFCLVHPRTLITHQMILFDHVAIFCFVFTDRFYGRQSDNSLKYKFTNIIIYMIWNSKLNWDLSS